jgi:hypothetical protein
MYGLSVYHLYENRIKKVSLRISYLEHLMLKLAIAIFFSILATTMMSYLCLAMPIGPWVEGTLVLLGIIIFRLVVRQAPSSYYTRAIGLSTAAGGIGGIAATAIAFSFPTLYFLDPNIFNTWLQHPLYFASILAGLVFTAGLCAMIFVEITQEEFLNDPALPFSIGQMVNRMVTAQNQFRRASELALGAVSAILFNAIQVASNFIPNSIILFNQRTISWWHVPALTLQWNMLPMLIAVGFVSGTMIALPLIVGMLSKIFFLDVIHQYFFSTMTSDNMILAFGGGMVVYGAFMTFSGIPYALMRTIRRIRQSSLQQVNWLYIKQQFHRGKWSYLIPSIIGAMVYFSFFEFSILSQLYIIIGSFLCLQQVLIIAGKQGIAPLGRFATFLMIPGLIIFGYTPIQVTLMATFVELVVGIGSDIMFGRKMAQLSQIDIKDIRRYQWIGLVVCALCVGGIVWLLIHNGELGGVNLCAQKARGRASLIRAYQFDYSIMFIGFIYSWLLSRIRVNPTLALGGFFLPPQITIPLCLGGLATMLVKEHEHFIAFFSGMFAANSIWMVISALLYNL